MNELTLDGKIYISSKRAAEISGYAKDYVGQLCREGRVEARLVGRNWYVLKEAIEKRQFEDSGAPEAQTEKSVDTVPQPRIEKVHYESEEVPAFPVMQDIVSPRRDAEDITANSLDTTPAEAGWSDWFDLEPTVSALASDSVVQEEAVEVAPEAPLEPIEPVLVAEDAPEPVNLRKIRDFIPREEEDIARPVIIHEEIVAKAPTRRARQSKKWLYPGVQATAVVVAALAVIIATIGTGYLSLPIFGQVNTLAGVAAYSKPETK